MNNQLNTQKFINEFGWQALEDELFITVKKYDCGIRVLNYSQTESPKTHPVVVECRALKLDESGQIISRAFDRFFNYGEADTLSFDFSNCVAYEKADGSLCVVYWCPQTNQWEISTRGTAFAEATYLYGFKTYVFRDSMLEAMKFSELEFQKAFSNCNKDVSYVMEFCSKTNRIVTPYDDSFMVLLDTINLNGNKEDFKLWCNKLQSLGMNIRLPKEYNVSSADELVKLAETLPDLEEGFVVYDFNTGKRVKCKSSLYVFVHRLKGNGQPTSKSLIELVADNEQDELLVYFDEFRPMVKEVEDKLDESLNSTQKLFDEYGKLPEQKDFALAVKSSPYSALLFFMRSKNLSNARDAFFNLDTQKRVSFLGKFVNV